MTDCEHKYHYEGVRYALGSEPRPGSGELADDVAAILTEEIDLAKQGSREEFAYLESQVPLIAQRIAVAALERCRGQASGNE